MSLSDEDLIKIRKVVKEVVVEELLKHIETQTVNNFNYSPLPLPEYPPYQVTCSTTTAPLEDRKYFNVDSK